MNSRRAFVLGVLLGGSLSVGLACGQPSTSCDGCSGCCDATGMCRPGSAADACGKNASVCSTCTTGQSCSVGACVGGSGAGGGVAGGAGGGVAGGAGGGVAGGAGGGVAGGAGGGVAGGAGGGAAGGAGGGAGALVVFNEICARDVDYLELFNAGQSAKDLSGYAIADSLDDGGAKVVDALTLPSGTSLAPGAFLLVVMDRNDAGATTSCLDGGASNCFGATFKVSNSRGETVWLLTPSGSVEQSLSYPMNGAPSGSSYGRMPDGTGSFTTTQRTPGAPNSL